MSHIVKVEVNPTLNIYFVVGMQGWQKREARRLPSLPSLQGLANPLSKKFNAILSIC